LSRESRETAGAGNDHVNAVELLAIRAGLTDYEKAVLQKVVSTDMTVHQIASAFSREESKLVTDSSVKHALDRVMTKLKVEPRTRAAVVKRVLELQRPRNEARDH
jgi:DNA-binding NarL/FixJ family response regulator